MSVVFWKKRKSSYNMIFFLVLLHLCSFTFGTHRLPFREHGVPNERSTLWNKFLGRKSILLSINSRPVKLPQEHRAPFREHNLPPTFVFPIRSDFNTKRNEDFSKVTMELPIYKARDFNNKHFSKILLHQKINNQWSSPTVSHTTYYNPFKPYEPPTKPAEEYGPPREPFETYEVPVKPADVYGPPEKPAETYGPPTKPAEVYGPPKKLCETLELPIKPAATYGLPRKPFRTYEVPAKPAEVYGPPEKPAETYGPPKIYFETYELPVKIPKPAETYGPPLKDCKHESHETFSPIDVRVDYKTDFSLPVRPPVDFNKQTRWFAPKNEDWKTSSWETTHNQHHQFDGISFGVPDYLKENNNYLPKYPIVFSPFENPQENHEDEW